ncbi:MAG: SnoaL-like domain [bacterium]
MPGTDLETVRRFFGGWTEGDLDGMLDLVHPEVAAKPLLGLLFRRVDYHGPAGIREWYEESRALGDRFEVTVEETRRADGAVVAFLHLVVHAGRRPYDARVAMVCGFRDGRIVSLVGRDAEEAAEALGGPPPPPGA